MTYTQLTQEQRYQIYALKKVGHSPSKITRTIGVHRATISRELSRNTGQRGYRPKQAQQLAMARRAKSQRRITEASWVVVKQKLSLEWSPEQITG